MFTTCSTSEMEKTRSSVRNFYNLALDGAGQGLKPFPNVLASTAGMHGATPDPGTLEACRPPARKPLGLGHRPGLQTRREGLPSTLSPTTLEVLSGNSLNSQEQRNSRTTGHYPELPSCQSSRQVLPSCDQSPERRAETPGHTRRIPQGLPVKAGWRAPSAGEQRRERRHFPEAAPRGGHAVSRRRDLAPGRDSIPAALPPRPILPWP